MPEPVAASSLTRHPSFMLFWCARTFTNGAYMMQGVAVGWQIYELTNDPFDLGLVGLVQFVPLVGFSVIIGQVADLFDRRFDRLAETLHDHVDCRSIDDERRRNQNMIAAHAVDRATRRIDHQPAGHRFALDARMHLQVRVECLLGAAIGDQLDPLQEAAPAHVADERMIAKALL